MDHARPDPGKVLATLVRLGERLAGYHEEPFLAHALADGITELLAPDQLIVGIRSSSSDPMRAVVVRGHEPDDSVDELLELAATVGPTLRRAPAESWSRHGLTVSGTPQVWLAHPIESQGQLLGAVSVTSFEPERFDSYHQAILKAALSQAAMALRGYRLWGQLSRGKRQWEDTVDAIGQAFCVLDVTGRVRRANRPFSKLVDQPVTEVSGRLWFELVPQTWVETIRNLMIREQSPQSTEIDDGERLLAVSVVSIGAPEDPGRLLIFDDQTEKRRLLDQLIQSEKMSAVGQLIVGVAHDLNNPLSSVVGFADYLAERGENVPPGFVEPLKTIQVEAERAAHIVRNLLWFARKHERKHETVSVVDVLSRTQSLLRNQAQAHRVKLEIVTEPDLPSVVAEASQLQQVFLNLVNNAVQVIDASGVGDEIRLEVSQGPGSVIVRVVDNGPGVPEEVQSRIFEPFFTTKSEGEGTGLGLSICQGILKEHGGRISLEESGSGGSVFRVELPASDVQLKEEPELPEVGHLQVLLIEGNEHARQYLSSALESWGHQVTMASDAREGLACMSEGEFDVILSDISVPSVDGQAFHETVIERYPQFAQRVVFSAGVAVSQPALDFLDSLGRPYLTKPFTMTELRRVVVRTAARAARSSG